MPDPDSIQSPSLGTVAMPIFGQMRAIGRLAAPVTVSRLGGLLLIIADVAMLGHADATELAYYGLANSIVMVPFLIGVGMLVGIAVLTAQARGAARDNECGTIWRVGLMHALVMGITFAALGFLGGDLLELIGQTPDLAGGGGRSVIALAVGLPGVLGFVACTIFLEAVGRPRAGVAVMLAANLVNLGLNAVMIEGWPDLGITGAVGAALATSICRTLMALALVVYILRLPEAERYNLRGPLQGPWQVSDRLRRLGYGFGLAQGLESAAFASLTMFAGFLGASAVAGYQIVLNVIALVFMAAVGVATATGVGVGHAVGRRDARAMAQAGWSGVATIALVLVAVAIVVVSAPEAIARLFSDDAAVLAMAVPAMVLAGLMLIPDGMQAVLMGALRGAGDVWAPTAMHLFAFVGVMMPGAWLLAIGLGYGLTGLIGGGLLGVSTATLLLGGRFALLTRRVVLPA